ncbi:hypothetical protein JR316_0012106 [Psilocybe cubensis]|nr:hypothetical protein JR316_0012106 [Psilocybe cubensis]KAH9475007.1 hypothetical protein JR316_0012106 [Psilocybe cubensis]
MLQVFKVVPRCWDDYIFLALEETTGRLFADSAPSLKEFAFPEAPELYISLQAPWMKHVSTLVLFGGFLSSDMIDALEDMGDHLEYLELKDGFMKPLVQPRQRVSLPHLRRLSVTNRLQICVFLLHYLIPAPGCSLFLSTHRNTHIYRNISPKDISDINTQIWRYADNFLSVHDAFVDTLRLAYNSRSFSFTLSHGHAPIATGSFISPGRRESPEFSVNIVAGFRLPKQTSRIFLDAIKLSPRTTIVTFDFTPSKVDPMDEENLRPTMVIPYLSSMTTLATSEYGFELLLLEERNACHLPCFIEDIFPSLHTFTLKYNGPLENRPTFEICILSFLKARIITGRPLPTLDVSDFALEKLWIRSRGREIKNWKYLEDIPGLKVILHSRRSIYGVVANFRNDGEWEEFYVCGSGEPNRLVS